MKFLVLLPTARVKTIQTFCERALCRLFDSANKLEDYPSSVVLHCLLNLPVGNKFLLPHIIAKSSTRFETYLA
jgi:hypothetical protein